MIWNKEIETASRSELEKIQLEKLKRLVRYCYDNVPFYKEKLDSAKISPDKIKALSDLRYIPFTVKNDLRDNYPYGMFAVPMKQVVRIHASSGTTGKPTVVGYTKNDLNMWAECMSRLVAAAGATDEDIVQICFGYGLFTGALGLHYALENIGAAVVPASSGNTEKQLMLMKDFGTTAIVATPTYAMYMAEKARELGYKKEDFKVKLGLFGSEGCTQSLREKLEEAWGLFATDNYGLSEIMGPGVSGECMERCGLHINEDHFICEIIDSKTGEVLPEGSEGELVITPLSKEAFPLLRYRTKDISRIVTEKCACGRTTARMDKVAGRCDDMLKIKGVNVFPSQIESVLVAMPHIGPHYQIVLTRNNFLDNMEIKVELLDGSLLTKYSELEKLQRTINQKLLSVLGLDAKITLVEPNTLERFTGKARRVTDLRNIK